MFKKTIIIIFAAIVLGGIIAFFAVRLRAGSGSGSPAAVAGNTTSSGVSVPMPGAPAGLTAPSGNTLQIGTPHGVVTVKNFYQNIVSSEDEFLVLQETPDYEITYDTTRSAFYIQFFPSTSTPSSAVRTAGENAFLQILGIGPSDACTVNVLEAPPANSPLGLCGAFQ